MRKIAVLTGTRADYGLWRPVLTEIRARDDLDLALIVTGMHFSAEFGLTVGEIERDGFRIAARVDMLLRSDTGGAMAKSLGICLLGVVQALEEIAPDILLVLGDRGEMLAGAIAAAHLGVLVAHLHGGERSGSIDGSLRHAITKLAHLHFPVTDDAVRCLLAAGEAPERIFKIGAPGLDVIEEAWQVTRAELETALGTELADGFILAVFHAVVGEEDESIAQFKAMLGAMTRVGRQCLLFLPNADAGREKILRALDDFGPGKDLHCLSHFPRRLYLGLLAQAVVMVGNSSSGILEAPSFGLPAINIGGRQRGRLRAGNVIDVSGGEEEIRIAILSALAARGARPVGDDPTGDTPYRGGGARPLAEILATIPITSRLLRKDFTF